MCLRGIRRADSTLSEPSHAAAAAEPRQKRPHVKLARSPLPDLAEFTGPPSALPILRESVHDRARPLLL